MHEIDLDFVIGVVKILFKYFLIQEFVTLTFVYFSKSTTIFTEVLYENNIHLAEYPQVGYLLLFGK